MVNESLDGRSPDTETLIRKLSPLRHSRLPHEKIQAGRNCIVILKIKP
jgi:hypothetical protein